MNKNRLSEIESLLKPLYKQKYGMEQARNLAPAEEKERINLRIKLEISSQIRDYEQEYWEIIANQSEATEIEEVEAEIVVAEFVEGVRQIQGEKAEIIDYLQKILAKVEQLDTTASAKLKGVISSIPPFVGISYEAELDTESFLRRYFPSLIKVVKRLKKPKKVEQTPHADVINQQGKYITNINKADGIHIGDR